jgi:hypothetical protein
MDTAALKVLKAAEDTKQVLQQKEEVLAEIRGEFEQKSREVGMLHFTCPKHSVLGGANHLRCCPSQICTFVVLPGILPVTDYALGLLRMSDM